MSTLKQLLKKTKKSQLPLKILTSELEDPVLIGDTMVMVLRKINYKAGYSAYWGYWIEDDWAHYGGRCYANDTYLGPSDFIFSIFAPDGLVLDELFLAKGPTHYTTWLGVTAKTYAVGQKITVEDSVFEPSCAGEWLDLQERISTGYPVEGGYVQLRVLGPSKRIPLPDRFYGLGEHTITTMDQAKAYALAWRNRRIR
jgi:hypothetical protein